MEQTHVQIRVPTCTLTQTSNRVLEAHALTTRPRKSPILPAIIIVSQNTSTAEHRPPPYTATLTDSPLFARATLMMSIHLGRSV